MQTGDIWRQNMERGPKNKWSESQTNPAKKLTKQEFTQYSTQRSKQEDSK